MHRAALVVMETIGFLFKLSILILLIVGIVVGLSTSDFAMFFVSAILLTGWLSGDMDDKV